MSRLFDALKSLEGEAAGHSSQPPPVGCKEPFAPKRRISWTRPALLLMVFLASGLILVLTYEKWGNKLLEIAGQSSLDTHYKLAGHPRPYAKPLPPTQAMERSASDSLHKKEMAESLFNAKQNNKPEKKEALQNVTSLHKSNAAKAVSTGKYRKVVNNTSSRAGKALPIRKKKAKPKRYQNLTLPDVMPKAAVPERNRPDYVRLRNALLSQAEEYRQNGQWKLALKSYEKLWQFSKEPDIANNYAGVLIVLGEYGKALKILKEAAKSAPSDKDIMRNMMIAEKKIEQQQSKPSTR